jgi:purine-binding chemotaxis protein CheW
VSEVYVRVGIGPEHYALPVDRVLEVAELGDLTPVPGSPPETMGVCNLRGQVIPVMDLAMVLDLPQGTPARIVVVELDQRRAGLAVDSVVDVGGLPDPTEQVDSPFLTGAVLVDGVLVGMLDADAVLSGGSPEPAA